MDKAQQYKSPLPLQIALAGPPTLNSQIDFDVGNWQLKSRC